MSKLIDFDALIASREDSTVDRDAMRRYPECPLDWCHYSEQCSAVRCCLHAKYKQEVENAATGV